jgi:ABC-type multidrug transport system ATPase subunit
MLVLKDIHKQFGDVCVLNGVNLRLEKGFVYALKDGNGSGKSAILKTIYGVLKPWMADKVDCILFVVFSEKKTLLKNYKTGFYEQKENFLMVFVRFRKFNSICEFPLVFFPMACD